jgi:hypothetical protein
MCKDKCVGTVEELSANLLIVPEFKAGQSFVISAGGSAFVNVLWLTTGFDPQAFLFRAVDF